MVKMVLFADAQAHRNFPVRMARQQIQRAPIPARVPPGIEILAPLQRGAHHVWIRRRQNHAVLPGHIDLQQRA
jgi:hypothetical protein